MILVTSGTFEDTLTHQTDLLLNLIMVAILWLITIGSSTIQKYRDQCRKREGLVTSGIFYLFIGMEKAISSPSAPPPVVGVTIIYLFIAIAALYMEKRKDKEEEI